MDGAGEHRLQRAYVLEEVVLNEFHSRVKSPTYWGADGVIIERVTGLVINDDNQALTRYRAGEGAAWPRLNLGSARSALSQSGRRSTG